MTAKTETAASTPPVTEDGEDRFARGARYTVELPFDDIMNPTGCAAAATLARR